VSEARSIRLKALRDARDAICPKCRAGVGTIGTDPAGWGWKHHENRQRTRCKATPIRELIYACEDPHGDRKDTP